MTVGYVAISSTENTGCSSCRDPRPGQQLLGLKEGRKLARWVEIWFEE